MARGTSDSRETREPRVRLRRAYDPPERADGLRVLVDRLWPRGLARAEAHVDEWPKEITPSAELRRWYHAAADRQRAWAEFRERYRVELAGSDAAGEALERLRERVRSGQVTLLTAVRDPEYGHAAVLAELLTEPGARRATS
ncbi:DUF488 family protein [Streptomyces sp. B6B3]|uniref:DUF488 domain-containing protein n=1 Tax=Streptomyces sp. B6B3 TaxID=3153570 RepID=UPI00325E0102